MRLEKTLCESFIGVTYLIGMPAFLGDRGSLTDRHGLVISSNTEGATYVKPWKNRVRQLMQEDVKYVPN